MPRFMVELRTGLVRATGRLYVTGPSKEAVQAQILARLYDSNDEFDDADFEVTDLDGLEILKVEEVREASPPR